MEVADGLAFEGHGVLGREEVGACGVVVGGEGAEGVGDARARDEEVDELAVHRIGGALE